MAASLFMPGVEDPNQIYILLCKELLPIGMIGMLISAMFSATLSMLSGDSNAVAAVLTNDVYKPLIAPNASERSLVWVGRVATILVGILALGISLQVAEAQGENDLFQLMANLFGVFLPSIALPMLAGLVTSKVSNTGGLLGLILGIAAGLVAHYLHEIPIGAGKPLDLRWLPVMTALTVGFTLIGLMVGSILAPNSPQATQEINRFLSGVKEEANLPFVKQEEGPEVSLGPVIGVSVGALGLLTISVAALMVPYPESKITWITGLCMTCAGGICWFFGRGSTTRQEVSEG
jgi:Na+/proline symporter